MTNRPDMPSSYKPQSEESGGGMQETLIWIGVVVLLVVGGLAFTLL